MAKVSSMNEKYIEKLRVAHAKALGECKIIDAEMSLAGKAFLVAEGNVRASNAELDQIEDTLKCLGVTV